MTDNSRTFDVKKSIAHIVFISCPSILLAGYGVYVTRDWLSSSKGIEVSDTVYWIILFIVMWVAMWVTSHKILKAVFGQEKRDETNLT